MWRRAHGNCSPKISYQDPVPSWSWMAYEGAISFVYGDYGWGEVDIFRHVHFSRIDLVGDIWSFKDSKLLVRPRDGTTDTELLDLNESVKGWISLDTEAELWDVPDLIVLARLQRSQEDGSRYFVLFVKERGPSKYERVGVGMIQHDCELIPLGRHSII